MNTVEKWYEVMKSNDMDELDELLAEDCCFLFSCCLHTSKRQRN